MSSLPLYVDTDPCPKCGTNYTTATWQPDVTEKRRETKAVLAKGTTWLGEPPAWYRRTIDAEHIEVKCNHCGYVWHCRTVDGWERAS